MRIAIVTLLLAGTALAGPPSKILERAIKLYDKQDYFSAHIELRKVVDKESGDDAQNTRRAEFFTGKVLYHMGLYAPSRAWFDKITIKGAAHEYYVASLKWHIAIADQMPIDLPVFASYAVKDFDDPSLHDLKSELLYRWVLASRARNPGAMQMLAKIDPASKVHGRATLARGLAELAAKGATATLDGIAAGSDEHDLARLALVRHHVRAGKLDKATAAMSTIRAGARRARAEWEVSAAQMKLAPALAKLATTPADPFELRGPEPAMLHVAITSALCPTKQTTSADALATFRANAAAIDKQLGELLAEQDHADFYARMTKELAAPSRLDKAIPFVRAAVSGPLVGPVVGFAAEMRRELALLQSFDKAWQTTSAAADALQVLTVESSVADADAGKVARARVAVLRVELAELAKQAGAKLATGPGKLVVQCP